ncbi:MAG: hypothetical protein SXU28_02545 [Pseudomonadota bacterium]|nr:hypothetical protein [Pseudomonadota bacterium]
MKRSAILVAAFALMANGEPQPSENASSESPFVGTYDGSSFELASGMVIRPDGTFQWGLSVGGLDLRAQGTWRQEGDFIYLTSNPKPVAPEFRFARIETYEGAPYLRVILAKSGREFQWADARITCRNGKSFGGQVHRDGYPSNAAREYDDRRDSEYDPLVGCDEPETVTLLQSNHAVRSKPFDLKKLGWKPGKTAVFAFHSNDLGTLDFTGVTGYLEGERIVFDVRPVGRRDFPGPMELVRKRPRSQEKP